MTEQSLLTDDVRALVGTTAAGGITHVTANSVRRAHEVYYGTPGDVPADGEDVPGITIAALATETGGINLPSLMPNTLLISNEWEFQRPLRLGEELQVRSRLA